MVAQAIDESQFWARVGVLGALALLASYVEVFIPIPIPGIKLGLANSIVLVALLVFDGKSALFVSIIKVLAAGFLFGSPIMMAYSAAGSLLAFVVMYALSRIPSLHTVVISIAGALFHIVGQLVVASMLLQTHLIWYSAPLFAVAAVVTGALNGFIANYLIEAIDSTPANNTSQLPFEFGVATSAQTSTARALALFVAFVVYVVVCLHTSRVIALGICVLVACICLIVARAKPIDVLKALRPLAFIVVFTLLMQVANNQQGEVLFSVGAVHFTREACVISLQMLVRLSCIIAVSFSFMNLVSRDELCALLSRITHPFSRFGFNARGLVLALDITLAFAPYLVESFDQQRKACATNKQSSRLGIKASVELLKPLIADAFSYADTLASRMRMAD